MLSSVDQSSLIEPITITNELRLCTLAEFRVALENLRCNDPTLYSTVSRFLFTIPKHRRRSP